MKKKTLLFDISSTESYFLLGHSTGVGRSTLELVKALDDFQDLSFNLTFFSQNIKGIGVRNLRTQHKRCHLYLPKRKPFTNFSNTFGLKKIISGYDVMHIPHNTDVPEKLQDTIYTIHDLIVYRYPEMWGLTDRMRQEHLRLASGCKAIVTCSDSSKMDIIKFWGLKEDKVHVIPWGVNRKVFRPDHSPVMEIDGLGTDFFFAPSCNHPRKQPALIVEAYDLYLKRGGSAQLVMLNPALNSSPKLEELVRNGKIKIVSGITDRLLVTLYSQAKASIVVSLYEGFGLPVLESLACGTQVICARNSSLVEAGGEIVDYMEELDSHTLCSKMLSYDSDDNKLNMDMCEGQLNKFSWSRCAGEYVKFWETQLNS